MAGERTEQATPRRRQKAKEEGDRPRSRDLLAAGATLGGVMTLGALGPRWVELWNGAYRQFLAMGTGEAWESSVPLGLAMRQTALLALWPIGLIFAAVFAGALAAGLAQGSGVHLPALQPKFSRLNPGSNLKNLFSAQAASRLGKSLLPASIVLVLAVGKLRQQEAIPAMSLTRLPAMFADGYALLKDTAWILFGWSLVDYGLEWQSWNRRLRMSKQEMRDEFKESEGSPETRGRIRNLQRQMRGRKLQADVSQATVVITNPTHYAVALSFDFETMDTPRVLAKGRNLMAEAIKKEARWAGVPIVENPPLARSLFKSVEPGQAIPLELYAAVAGILAYLYRKEVEEKMRRRQQEERTAASAVPGAGANSRSSSPQSASTQSSSPQSSSTQSASQQSSRPRDAGNSQPMRNDSQ